MTFLAHTPVCRRQTKRVYSTLLWLQRPNSYLPPCCFAADSRFSVFAVVRDKTSSVTTLATISDGVHSVAGSLESAWTVHALWASGAQVVAPCGIAPLDTAFTG